MLLSGIDIFYCIPKYSSHITQQQKDIHQAQFYSFCSNEIKNSF